MNTPIVIDLKTAEYLAILLGQTNWGNGTRRSAAAAALGAALKGQDLSTSQECFASSEKGRR